jgi:hypothetical protein
MRPKKHKATGSNDLFRARLDHGIRLRQSYSRVTKAAALDGYIASALLCVR